MHFEQILSEIESFHLNLLVDLNTYFIICQSQTLVTIYVHYTT